MSDLSDGSAGRRVLGDGLAVKRSVELWGVVVLIYHEHHNDSLVAEGRLTKVICLIKYVEFRTDMMLLLCSWETRRH